MNMHGRLIGKWTLISCECLDCSDEFRTSFLSAVDVDQPQLVSFLLLVVLNGILITFASGGWISGYNGESYGVKNLFQFVAKRLMMRGFIVSDFEASPKPFADQVMIG